MKLFKLLAIFVLLGPLLHAEGLTISEIATKARALRASINFKATAKLVKVSKSGERKSFRISLKGKAFTDDLQFFLEVTDPAPDRIRLLLQVNPSGKAKIYTGHAGDRAPREIAFKSWGEPFLNSDISYEDLLENFLLWQNQILVKEEKYGARICYLVRSEPSAQDNSYYSSVSSWLDREVLFPAKVEKTMKVSGTVKEFIYYGLRESGGMWSASQIEVRIKDRPDSTFLVFNRGSAKANLKKPDFLPALLIKPE
jgi:hypothetical protein